MYSFLKTLGISILILIVTSFVGILLLGDVLLVSMVVLLITYFCNGIIAAKTNNTYPYFAAYMSAIVLILINFIFSIVLLDINVFINADIVFSALLTGTLVSLVGAQLQLYLRRRSEHV
ncbi:hypothetical protein [Bacillus sp. PS06]|uniref:hypothetical protein n=1 Tax=Bacillus sp. PS06 TaxID=2764176 RepID=UPI001786BC97|nr:hypothetical protein [Bacillus sp. PS06]MBD8071140.1 hypothetical protein [Bacillus sp. PS06]